MAMAEPILSDADRHRELDTKLFGGPNPPCGDGTHWVEQPTGINRSQLGLDLDATEPAAISRPAAIGTVDAFAQAPCPPRSFQHPERDPRRSRSGCWNERG